MAVYYIGNIPYGMNDIWHHGVLGQKWGKRNGPPYPLSANDHSTSEKKAGWRKSINRKESTSDTHKKYIKYGAIAVGATLAMAGAVYLAKSGKLGAVTNLGRQYIESQFASGSVVNIGKAAKDISTEMVANINSANYNTLGGRTNCAHTTVSYILNSMFGKNTTALPYNGIDEVSGMVIPQGRSFKVFSSIFDNLNVRECSDTETMADMLKSLKPGSTGILMLGQRNGAGHYVNYEKTKDGITTIIDPQTNIILNSKYYENDRFVPWRVLDFSNATIKENAKDILKYMIGGYHD